VSGFGVSAPVGENAGANGLRAEQDVSRSGVMTYSCVPNVIMRGIRSARQRAGREIAQPAVF